MKKSMTLDEIAVEVARQVDVRQDYVVPQDTIRFLPAGPTAGEALAFQGKAFPMTELTHRQVAASLGIPYGFYLKLQNNHPDIHETTVNRLMGESDKGRMVRTLDGKARAFLSERFLRVDANQLMDILIPELESLGLVTESAHCDAERLYVKAFTPALEGEIAKGDVIRGGIVFATSEVGLGRIIVSPMTYRLICTNGMVAGMDMGSYRRRHVGPVAMPDADGLVMDEIAPTFAKMAESIRASIRGALSHESFSALLEELRISRGMEIPAGLDLELLMVRLRRKFSLLDAEASAILGYLDTEEKSIFGVIQAITRHAQDVAGYHRATELETMGGSMLRISRNEWARLTEPAVGSAA